MSTELPRVLCQECGEDVTNLLPPGEVVEVVTVTCNMAMSTPHHVVVHRPPVE